MNDVTALHLAMLLTAPTPDHAAWYLIQLSLEEVLDVSDALRILTAA